jgi:hypothetical protein
VVNVSVTTIYEATKPCSIDKVTNPSYNRVVTKYLPYGSIATLYHHGGIEVFLVCENVKGTMSITQIQHIVV